MSKFVHNIDEAFEALREQTDLLQAKADGVIATPLPLHKYPNYNSKDYIWSLWGHTRYNGDFDLRNEYFYKKDSSWSNTLPEPFEPLHIENTLNHFDKTFNKWKEDCEELVQLNRDVITHNKKQIEKLKLIMKTLGVSDTYSTWEYKTSRSSKKTETKHNAGYLGDMSRTIVTVDNYETMCKVIEKKRMDIENLGKKYLKESQDKQRKLLQSKQEQDKIVELAGLRAKYTPDNLKSDIYEIQDKLLDCDKYLSLAYWLERNRGDWSDGYYYAETGLSSFIVETKQDQEIEDDIQECINNWDGDGRVFRDTDWNYAELYNLVENKTLLSDLEILVKYEDY